MSDDDERAVRLLRAKARELETRANSAGAHWNDHDYLVADVALIAGLLADYIERTDPA